MNDLDLPTISEWLRGRSVFVTGATGFVGKVLVEKLIRSIPELDAVYILVREKKGQAGDDRLQKMLSSPLYDVLRRENPEQLKKVKVINGDVSLIGLGLSEEDRKFLQEKISVVFHAAASVRFDQPLKQAVYLNVRGTREIVELCKGIKNLQALVHVSTAYSNCEHPVIEEKIYEPKMNWRKMIKAAEMFEEHELEVLCRKVMEKTPNTYIFTKGLAENIIDDYKHEIPVVIFRPSVVIQAYLEPIVGWMDHLSSPVGIAAAVGKGVLRVYPTRKGIKTDYIPVDMNARGMITVAWYRSQYTKKENPETSPKLIFNATTEQAEPDELVRVGHTRQEIEPLSGILWKQYFFYCSNYYLYHILFIFLHLIQGALIDGILKLQGKKTRLLRIYRLIYVAFDAVTYFASRTWNMKTENFDTLTKILKPEDVKNFEIVQVKDRFDYLCKSYTCMRLYVLNEPKEIPKSTFQHNERMVFMDRILKIILVGLVIWIIPYQWLYSTSTSLLAVLS